MSSAMNTYTCYPTARVFNWENQSTFHSFNCIICYNIPKNARQCTSCERIVCKECIEKNNGKCPVPHEGISQITAPNKSAQRVINEMKIICINERNGCHTVQPYANIEEHERECIYQIVKCTAYEDCKTTELKINLADHESQCQAFPLACPHCHVKYKRAKLEAHANNCSKKKIQCAHCNQDKTLGTIDQHVQQCDEAPVKCSTCTEQMKRKHRKRHECLKFLCKNIQAMKADIASAQKNVLNDPKNLEKAEVLIKCVANIDSNKSKDGQGLLKELIKVNTENQELHKTINSLKLDNKQIKETLSSVLTENANIKARVGEIINFLKENKSFGTYKPSYTSSAHYKSTSSIKKEISSIKYKFTSQLTSRNSDDESNDSLNKTFGGHQSNSVLGFTADEERKIFTGRALETPKRTLKPDSSSKMI